MTCLAVLVSVLCVNQTLTSLLAMIQEDTALV